MEKPHKKLDVWRQSMQLASRIYRATELLPDTEKYGLISQMRRAAVSVPCNIAEGAARKSNNEFRHFLSIARGSLSELDTQLDLCQELNLMSSHARREFDEQLMRIDKMLYALHQMKTTIG